MPTKINGSKNAKKRNFKILIFFVLFAIALFSFLSGFVVFASENAKDGGEKSSESRGVFSEKNESSDFLENFENQKSAVRNFLSGENPCSVENLPLYFGNPSRATSEADNAKNYLMEKTQFSLSYNALKLIPNWVSWHLSKNDMGDVVRGNDFRADLNLPSGFYAVKKADYRFSIYGFDRGHVCPSADRTQNQDDNSATFLMTNMIPQSPNCNRNVWKNLESYERNLAFSGKELYITAGPYGCGGTSEKGRFEKIALENGMSIEVPEYCWKIILILDEGSNDFFRVDEKTEIIAAWIPNNQVVSDFTWDYYITTTDFIEEKTGFDFFAALPDSIEDAIEAKKYVCPK